MQHLKKINLSIQNESVVESTKDIVISTQNNSENDVTVKEGGALYYLTWKCEMMPSQANYLKRNN